MFRLGLVVTLVTHANKEGFGLTPLSRDLRGYMPQKTKTKLPQGALKTVIRFLDGASLKKKSAPKTYKQMKIEPNLEDLSPNRKSESYGEK